MDLDIHLSKYKKTESTSTHTIFLTRLHPGTYHTAIHLLFGSPPVTLIISAYCRVLQLLCGNLPACRDGVRIQRILEREKERSCDDTLCYLWSNTYTSSVSFPLLRLQEHSPPYSPLYPSSLIILLNVVNILSFGPSLPATCILLLTVIYGYVILVASSLPSAPR